MKSLDIFLSRTFLSLETFLQKATTLNIFEALIFNYKIKVNSVEQCSPQFIAFVVDLCNELQIILRDNIGVIDRTESLDKTGTTFCQLQPLNPEFIEISPLTNESVPELRDKDEWEVPAEDVQTVIQNETHEQNEEAQIVHEKNSAIHVCEHCKRKYRTDGKFSKHLCKCKSASLKGDESVDDPDTSAGDELPQPSRVSEASIYVCAVCFATYSQQESFKHHKHDYNSKEVELVTDSEQLQRLRKFSCGVCGEVYRSLPRISYHVARCQAGPYHCELCLHVAASKQLLNSHKKKHHKNVECFFCPECGLGFKLRTSLQKHMVNRHETEQGTFTCDIPGCGQKFSKKIHLTNHRIEVHGLERKFLCQICGHKFMTQESLASHLESHSHLKKFQCQFCNKAFTTKEKMTFHIRTHTGEKPFSCNQQGCPKSFVSKTKLVEHLQRHSGTKRHKCGACGKQYANKPDLRLHLRKLHPESVSEEPLGEPEQEADAVSQAEPQLVLQEEQLFTNLPYSACYPPPVHLVSVPQSIVITSYDTIIGM